MNRGSFCRLSSILVGLVFLSPVWAEPPLRQVIDTEVRAAWQREKITPAGRADDATFIRRIYLDLVGTIPTLDETRQFLQDAATDKRARLIDRLLEDPRYATHQADIWNPLLIGRKS